MGPRHTGRYGHHGQYDEYASEAEKQEYYDRYYDEVPEGCSACGGPYPSCCSSCSMFDD